MYRGCQLDRRAYSISLVILEICGSAKEEISDKILQKSKKTLNECCFQTLRRGDVFSSYSRTQTVVMLVVANESDESKVINRLRDKFNSSVKHENTYLTAETQSVKLASKLT